jgi:hypothetical protein
MKKNPRINANYIILVFFPSFSQDTLSEKSSISGDRRSISIIYRPFRAAGWGLFMIQKRLAAFDPLMDNGFSPSTPFNSPIKK